MIIKCQACNTKFRVGDDKVKPPGIKVRCSKCGEVFFFEYSLHEKDHEEFEANPFQESLSETTPEEIEEDIRAEEAPVPDGDPLAASPEQESEIIDRSEGVSLETEASQEAGAEEDKYSIEEQTADTGNMEDVPSTAEEAPMPDGDPLAASPEQESEIIDRSEGVSIETEAPKEAGAEEDQYSAEELTADDSSAESISSTDEMSKLSKEISAAQIGLGAIEDSTDEQETTDKPAEDGPAAEDVTVAAAEAATGSPGDSISQDVSAQGSEFKAFAEQESERSGKGPYAESTLVVDQDVLEQTYTRGTVASTQPLSDQAKVKTGASVRRYPRRIRKDRSSRKIITWLLTFIFLGALFLSSMFVLNELKIYENDYFQRFDSVVGVIFGGTGKYARSKDIVISNSKGQWFNSKYGQVYVVKGDIINKADDSINFVKLNINYISDDENIFTQDIYAGNTLTDWEIKNKSFNSILSKLNRKNGDVVYEDVNNLDGLNFDIKPGEKVPFYSVFPAESKILGLKYKASVINFEKIEVKE